jgi:hypothetical protein
MSNYSAAAAQVQDAAMEEVQVGFKTLRLRPGVLVHAQRITNGSASFDAQFLGVINGKGIMLAPLGHFQLEDGLHSGERVLIRGFSGQYDFYFESQVLQFFDYRLRNPPLASALLSYPETVEAKLVRNAMRVRACLPAAVSTAGQAHPVAVTLVDVSVTGALINSPLPLGAVGDRFDLAVSIDFEEQRQDLLIPSTICRCERSDAQADFQIGLLFQNISQRDKLLLYYFVLSSAE